MTASLHTKEPLVFQPIYKERVWGGRSLEDVYGRALPRPDVPYGESWEIVDRPEAQSIVAGPGPWEGKTLHELWTSCGRELFGVEPETDRFPLLIKILDARDRLSVQVHPPARLAAELGGEPKTEMWYIAHAAPDAVLYVGLKDGISKEDFEAGIRSGSTEQQIHSIPVKAGQFIFIPSGRLHAIGAGLLIYEIQENSDSTYRVFDWNRLGMDGSPRRLHVENSLLCIDFSDIEPSMDEADGETLTVCPYFRVEKWNLSPDGRNAVVNGLFSLLTVIEGAVACGSREFQPGDFFIVPANASPEAATVRAVGQSAAVLRTSIR